MEYSKYLVIYIHLTYTHESSESERNQEAFSINWRIDRIQWVHFVIYWPLKSLIFQLKLTILNSEPHFEHFSRFNELVDWGAIRLSVKVFSNNRRKNDCSHFRENLCFFFIVPHFSSFRGVYIVKWALEEFFFFGTKLTNLALPPNWPNAWENFLRSTFHGINDVIGNDLIRFLRWNAF